MSQKKNKWIFVGCLLLFFAALTVIALIPGQETTIFGGSHGQVVISEIMADNRTYPAPNGTCCDYVEVCNVSDAPVDLSGWFLTDHPDEVGYTFPQGTVLQPGGYALCWCDRTAVGYGRFGISKSGNDTIYLYNAANVLVDRKAVAPTQENHPLMLRDGVWEESEFATPGFGNEEEGYAMWLQSKDAPVSDVVISEVMTANGSVRSENGAFCDWIELHNRGQQSVTLEGSYLSDDPAQPLAWQLSALTLQPGERKVIWLENAPFALSRSGCDVVLTDALGRTLDHVKVPQMVPERTWSLQADGSYGAALATPGYDNTQEGRGQWLAAQTPPGKLIISEVMPSNDRYLRQSDGKYYDWLELKNISAEPIELSQYTLSDDPEQPDRFRLPQQTLAPGARITVICSGGVWLTGGIQAPFSLSREECCVYLTGPQGLSDWLHIVDVPYGGSAGRTEEDGTPCYFARPTPGNANGEGKLFLSIEPKVLTPEGIYEDVTQVTVALSGENIRYTLDGSVPTAESALYTQPITLTATGVIRAASFCDGAMPSDTVTASYIINEGHTLPVLSLAADPYELLGGGGIYRNYKTEKEIPCNLKLFEEGGSFSIDCGLKMHGHTGLEYPKKSFKVNFRGRYGADVLSYPVYGEDGPQLYDSLCIRAGQDYPSSIFRDELFASPARQMGGRVLNQKEKFCILYINGEYFGIYCLKEAFSETYYAQNNHVSEQSVTVLQAPVSPDTQMYEIIQYCQNHDLSQAEHYEYVAARVDVDSLIDWMILEGYSCNGDVQQNLRYFKSTEDGDKWKPALYDLDWAFYYHDPMYHVVSAGPGWQHTALTRGLLNNPQFREKFLSRLSWAMENVLSNENVLALIDEYCRLLDAEVPRERQRWDGEYEGWLGSVNKLRGFITDHDHLGRIVENLRIFIGLTGEEEAKYFGRWAT